MGVKSPADRLSAAFGVKFGNLPSLIGKKPALSRNCEANHKAKPDHPFLPVRTPSRIREQPQLTGLAPFFSKRGVECGKNVIKRMCFK